MLQLKKQTVTVGLYISVKSSVVSCYNIIMLCHDLKKSLKN